MPLDPNIILQAGRGVPQLDNPLEVQGRVMSLRNMAGQQQLQQMQIDQAQRAQEQERTLSDLYRGAISPDGTINRQAVLSGAAEKGLGSKIPGLQKQFADADKAKADVDETLAKTDASKFKVLKDRLDVAGGAINSLLSRPNVTHDDVIQTVTGLVQGGVIDANQGAQMVRQLPGNPAMLRQFLVQKGLETMDAAKRMEMLTPKFEKMDNGGALITGTVDPLTGQFSQGGAIKKVATPDAVLSSQTTMRGQNMTDARERALAQGAMTYQQDADGNIVGLPTRAAPGGAIKATPVVAPGPGFQPLQGKGSMTEDQGKASGWLAQANNAYANAMSAIKRNPSALTPGVGDAVAAIPGGGAIGRTMQSNERQQFNQAMSSMSEAMLRAATGAGINKFEAEQKVAELTPQFGDSEAVIKQKMDAIPVYLKALEMRAGPGAKKVGGAATTAPAAAPAAGTIDFQLPPDIQAILNKHGAR